MINTDMNQKVDEMIDAENDGISQSAKIESGSVFTGEQEQVAGLRGLILKGAKKVSEVPVGESAVVKEVLKETLQDPKKSIKRDIKVKKPEVSPKKITPNLPNVDDVNAIPRDTNVTPAPEVKQLDLPSSEKIGEFMQRREQILDEGAAPVSPAPSESMLIRGIGQGQLSTVPYDDAGMRATLQASSELFLKENESITIQQLYDSAVAKGLPKKAVRKILEGAPFESKVGDYQLAKNTAGLLKAMDESTSYITDLSKKFAETPESITDVDLFNYAQQMAVHNSLISTVNAVGPDISAALNSFRRAKETMGALGGNDFRNFLDSVIDKESAVKFAKLYVKSSEKGKNKLIQKQQGLLSKLSEGLWYTYQSNLLSDISTWASNFTGATVQNALMVGEEFLMAGVTSPIRRVVTGAKDGYYMEDVLNGINGLGHGLIDGWRSAVHVMKTGERQGFKSQGKINPWTAENLSNTPLYQNAPDALTTGDLTGSWIGRVIDGAGYLHSIPFKALAAGDEITSGGIAQIALNRETSAFARLRYQELSAAGKTDDEIKKILVDEIDEFRETQPPEIFNSVEEIRSLANLTYAWDKTMMLDKIYNGVEATLKLPIINTFIPFAPTLTRVFDQAASRVPGMQVISPQFYKDVSRGGVYADRAMARLISGGIIPTMMVTTNVFEDRFTGGGPTDTALKKSMEEQGWQEYSIVFNKDELSDENKAKLASFLNVKESKEKIYISYKRFDQISHIVAAAADFGESLKMYQQKPDDEEWQKYALASAAYVTQFTSELPIMSAINDLVTASMGKYEDKGEKATEILQKLAETTGVRLAMSIPYIGYAFGTQSSHIARLIDPEQKSKMPDTIGASDARAALEKIKNNLQARIPLMRGDVENELDVVGRPIVDKANVREAWMNFVPFIKAKRTNVSEFDKLMTDIKYGFPIPQKTWDGVALNAVEYNKFKKLYGQEIKMMQPVMKDFEAGKVEYEPMSLEKAIINRLAFAEASKQLSEGMPLLMSEKHDEIDKIVSEYREQAKLRMIGSDQIPDNMYFDIEFVGNKQIQTMKQIESPELRRKIDDYKFNRRVAPVGQPLM